MIKYIVFVFIFNINLYASSFEGCGVYRFSGILLEDKEAKLGFSYYVNPQTRSQMKFEFQDPKELAVLMPFLSIETSLEASITKEMDGTKGVFRELEKIERRLPNPLNAKTTGIWLAKKTKCQK